MYFSSKIPSIPLPQGFLLWGTWKMGNSAATQRTPSYHMKHSGSEVKETEKGEGKSCVIYDTGPCSYMGSPFMSTPRYGPHMWRGISAALESHFSSPHCISLHLTQRFWKQRSSPTPSFHGFEGHFISPQVSVSVTNSSESGRANISGTCLRAAAYRCYCWWSTMQRKS